MNEIENEMNTHAEQRQENEGKADADADGRDVRAHCCAHSNGKSVRVRTHVYGLTYVRTYSMSELNL